MDIRLSSPITGYKFSTLTFDESIALLCQWSREPSSATRYFACVNPHSLMVAGRDPDFSKSISDADMITPDGTGIVIASRILNAGVPERVCGPDIFPALCATLNLEIAGTRMFFLGSSEENLAVLKQRFVKEFPNLHFVGSYAPPFRKVFSEDDNQEIVERVNNAGADILWIGLGAPKQEKWAHQNRHRLNVNLIGPVGGVFDFFTGRVKLPPKWVQRFGMISIYRLMQEPRRLWRRNLDSPIFLYRVFGQLLREGRSSSKHWT